MNERVQAINLMSILYRVKSKVDKIPYLSDKIHVYDKNWRESFFIKNFKNRKPFYQYSSAEKMYSNLSIIQNKIRYKLIRRNQRLNELILLL